MCSVYQGRFNLKATFSQCLTQHPVSGVSFCRYRTRCVRDEGLVNPRTYTMKAGRPQSAVAERSYPKPWLVGTRSTSPTKSSRCPSAQSLPATGRVSRGGAPRLPRTGGREQHEDMTSSRPTSAPAQLPRMRRRSSEHRTPPTVSEGPESDSRHCTVVRGGSEERQRVVEQGPTLVLDLQTRVAIDDSFPAILRGCAVGSITEVKNALDAGAVVDGQDAGRYGGVTPLIAACGFGHTQVATLLLSRGAGVNVGVADANQASPLFVAAANGHLDTVRLLVAHGARVEQTTRTTYGAGVALRVHGIHVGDELDQKGHLAVDSIASCHI